MKFKNPLLVVTDMENSKRFYREVLGLHVTMDLGANVTLTGGVCLQTKASWLEFIGASDEDVVLGGKDPEIYFEENHFDAFIDLRKKFEEIQYVHPVLEHSRGTKSHALLRPRPSYD